MCARHKTDTPDPRVKIDISPDPTVTDDDLADQTSPDDRRVPPEPYPSGSRMRRNCRLIVLISLAAYAVLGLGLGLYGWLAHGLSGLAGVLLGLLTVTLFCLSTPVLMSFLATNRLNSPGRMGGYLKALAFFLLLKVVVLALLLGALLGAHWFSRPLFAMAAVGAGLVYLAVLAVVVIRANHGHAHTNAQKNDTNAQKNEEEPARRS